MLKENNRITVLISAAASPAAVSLIIHLRKLGYFVIGMDANIHAAPLGEKYCNKFLVSPLATDEAYLPFLRELLSECDIFFPFIDEELDALISAPDLDVFRKKIMLSDTQSVAVCLDKAHLQKHCTDQGITIAPIATCAPALYKPRKGRGSKGIYFIDNEDMFKVFAKDQSGILQERLVGIEYTIDALFNKSGSPIIQVARQRLLASGVSTIGYVDQNTEIMEFTRNLSRLFQFLGLVNFQVMLTKNGPVLIEINPRLSGSLIFSIMAGADLINAAINIHLYGQEPKKTSIKRGKYIRYWSEHECQ